MKLVDYFDKHGCDKGSQKHRYDRVYEPVFESFNKKFTLLEIGIFKGDSIAATVEYAPNSTFVGIDTFQRIAPKNILIINHDNVSWLQCSSLNKPDEKFDILVPSGVFDIIIDDGLHTHDAQRKTFENFFPLLKDNGVYFIEDVWPFDIMGWMEKQHPWLKKHPMSWNDKEYKKLLETISPYNVTFHDIREGYDPDTFIIEIRK